MAMASRLTICGLPIRCLVPRACLSRCAPATRPIFRSAARAFSARAVDTSVETSVKHVFVRCKSSGSMIVSMYNVLEHPPTTPLLLYLPPKPQPHLVATEAFEGDEDPEPEALTDDLARPPDYLLRQNMPIVSIRYRWAAAVGGDGNGNGNIKNKYKDKVPPLAHIWPTPLHDVMFAYDWIKKYLAPPCDLEDQRPYCVQTMPLQPRRDMYVYGAQLGGGLATALALTEAHTNQHMAIRGVAAFNGIYNWTAFVKMGADGIPVADNAAAVQRIVPGTPPLASLFDTPADLFDSFASPCLLFRTTGRVVPPVDFEEAANRQRIEEAELRLEQMEARAALNINGQPVPKRTTSILTMGMMPKSYLSFPPMDSRLVIPQTLLLHTSTEEEQEAAALSRSKSDKKMRTETKPRNIPEAVHGKNSYAVQADELASLMRRGIKIYEMKRKILDELASLMRRGIEKYEMKRNLLDKLSEYTALEYANDDDDKMVAKSTEAEHRVQVHRVGGSEAGELDEAGQAMLLRWLQEHTAGSTASPLPSRDDV